MLLLGPVFDVELVTTARRARYYALRFGYGLVLLVVVASRYGQIRGETATAGPTPKQMVAFAGELFVILNGGQILAILALTPALVAPTIADERRRKTLRDLLASELSGVEIVGGKLAARLLHAMVILAAGVPVFGLLTLFGGIEPRQVALAFAGASSSAFFVAGLAILASATSDRPRDAVGLAYLLEILWLIAPWGISSLASGWPMAESVAAPVSGWLAESLPTSLGRFGIGFDDSAVVPILRMIGIQAVLGLGLVALAVWRLRPRDRAVGSGSVSARRRPLARPMGDDPMLWKEVRVARGGGLFRVVATGVGLVGLSALGFQVATTAPAAFEELAQHGYGVGTGMDVQRRGDLHSLVSLATFAVSLAWLVAVASSAASGLTSEREEDTWISLVGTPMDGREILRAKRLGALLRPRALALTLLILWAVGTAAGSIHPLGLAALVAEMAAVGGFAAALGTYVSLRSRTTARALAATLSAVFGLAVAIPASGLLLDAGHLWDISFALSPPILLSSSCADYNRTLHSLGWGEEAGPSWASSFVRDAAAALAATMLYSTSAWFLARRADSRFDREVDRPRRPARTSLS